MTISSRSTKAEILAAYTAIVNQPTTAADVLAWLQRTAATIRSEVVGLVTDCYMLGRASRRCYDSVAAELSRPLLKP